MFHKRDQHVIQRRFGHRYWASRRKILALELQGHREHVWRYLLRKLNTPLSFDRGNLAHCAFNDEIRRVHKIEGDDTCSCRCARGTECHACLRKIKEGGGANVTIKLATYIWYEHNTLGIPFTRRRYICTKGKSHRDARCRSKPHSSKSKEKILQGLYG